MTKQFNTRKPSGIQSSPVILLAGVAGAGKTWAAVEATAAPEVHRAFFIEIGEGVADAYGAVPGADFEIIEHDGSIGQIRDAIRWAAEQPAEPEKYNMLILDSLTEVWDLLKDNAAAEMMQRIKRKQRRLNGGEPKPDMDLWNKAGEVSDGLMRQLLDFPGPVICTARLDEVTEINDSGRPSGAKDWKIQVNKKVPFRVSAVVQARSPRTWHLEKIVSTNPNLQIQPGELKPLPDFTVAKLMEAMQVKPNAPGSTMVEPKIDSALSEKSQPQQQQQAQRPAQQQTQQQPAQRQQSPEQRKQDIAEFAKQLMQREQQGDFNGIESACNYYSQHGDREKTQMARATLDRMQRKAEQDAAAEAHRVQQTETQQSAQSAENNQQQSPDMTQAMEIVEGQLIES